MVVDDQSLNLGRPLTTRFLVDFSLACHMVPFEWYSHIRCSCRHCVRILSKSILIILSHGARGVQYILPIH